MLGAKTTEYCYQASGGASVNHGAQCRPLPKLNATCDDIVLKPGGVCTGDTSTGIRVDFAFP
jgi:hypothetical protein